MKDLDALLKRLRKQGYDITKGWRGHLKIRDGNGRVVASSSSTPSDWRALRNLRGQVRRAEASK